jgi:DHA2 family multidrug resistance protein
MTNTHERFSSLDRLLITIAVMTATLMQVLDTTIVNVALPTMQGSLSATPDEITWVLTSYLVASAIFMPLTGYFTDILGRKNYLLICILGFVITSGLCGAATSIGGMVFFRLLQGVFGAALVPLSQAILADVYPPEERGKAMAIWGIGVMVGPILGPTLGGYLTEVASWRWTFYINLPVGILALLIVWQVMPTGDKKPRNMDWLGLTLLSCGIGGTQYALDRGNHADWFSSIEIWIASFLAIGGIVGFCVNSYYQKTKSVFDIRIFKDRNFLVSSSILAMFGLSVFGGMVVLPLLLENLLNYPVITTGFAMAPRGISAMVSMVIVSKLIKTVDPRIIVIVGIMFCTLGSIPGTYYNLDINTWWIIWPLIVQGFGIGLMFVPLSAVAYSTLPDSMRAEAAGLFSLLRTMGSAVGISIIITLYTRHVQTSWNHLSGFVTPYNPAVASYLQNMHLDIQNPLSIPLIANELGKQAQMLAFIDVYAFIAWSILGMLPLVFFIKHLKRTQ